MDYTSIPEHMLPETCADDASKWASAFCQTAKKLGQDIDEGWMVGWFANAIEASWDKRIRAIPPFVQTATQ